MKNNLFFKLFKTLLLISAAFTFFSCTTLPKKTRHPLITVSRNIMDTGKLTPKQLAAFFKFNNPEIDDDFIETFAGYYVEEALAEGVNSDVAFAQMCHETGFLRFGGLVQPEWHNYCGLGAMSPEKPGEKFETEQLGVRAHIQHLQAYGTTEDIALNQELIDPRYSWVHKTKYVEDIWGLTGTWATDPEYGNKLDQMLSRMELILNK